MSRSEEPEEGFTSGLCWSRQENILKVFVQDVAVVVTVRLVKVGLLPPGQESRLQ